MGIIHKQNRDFKNECERTQRFLDATSHLYNWVFPSVHLSMGPSGMLKNRREAHLMGSICSFCVMIQLIYIMQSFDFYCFFTLKQFFKGDCKLKQFEFYAWVKKLDISWNLSCLDQGNNKGSKFMHSNWRAFCSISVDFI